MNCRHVRQLLSMAHDGRAPGGQDAALTAHLRDCPACRQFQSQMAALGGKLRTVSGWEPAPRRNLRGRALDRWTARQENGRRQPWSFLTLTAFPVRATALGMGAAVLFAAAVSLARWEQGRRGGAWISIAAQKSPSAPGTPPRRALPLPSTSHPGAQLARGKRATLHLPAPDRPRFTSPELPGGGLIATGPHVRSRPSQHPAPQRAPGATASPGHPGTHAAPSRGMPDEQYLDGRDPSLLAKWSAAGGKEQERLAAILKRLPPPADDFARIPYPQIAGLGGAAIAAAVQQYKDEAKVVDPRLFRKVAMQDKGTALSDFCAELQEQTGVKLTASRAVADEKVTVFVKEEPARNVMRAVSHLFGYFWLRSGHEGEYRYELDQDLKSQLAEEEMRRRDQDAALIAMDQQAQTFRPYVDLSYGEFRKRWEQLPSSEQGPLFNGVYNGGWGGMELYQRLTPRDQAALIAGQELIFRPGDPDPERRLSPEFAHEALMAWNPRVVGEDRPVSELPGARTKLLTLRLNRTELGQVSLIAHMAVAWPAKYGDSLTFNFTELATGRNPSTAKPANATVNARLQGRPPFDRVVTLRPEPSCPQERAALAGRSQRLPHGSYGTVISNPQQPHVFSSDVWEAVHRATGLPIVADYYTRLYSLDRMTIGHKPLFDALCSVGDALGARWRKEGDFLLARSTTYYWDKRKEVPNRYLLRWQQEERDGPGLSIDTLMQIASLPDEELDSIVEGEAIQHCWGINEWGMIMPTQFQGATGYRQDLRFLAELTPEHRRRALQPEGLRASEMTPAERVALLQRWEAIGRQYQLQAEDPPAADPKSYSVSYVPAGWYVWTPPGSSSEHPWPRDLHRIAARTAAEALAAARRIYRAASADQVSLCKTGDFRAGIRLTGAP